MSFDIGFGLRPAPQAPVPKITLHNASLQRAEALLQKNDFGSLLADKDLFFSVFCKVVADQPQKGFWFSISMGGRNISGREHCIGYLKETIEKIRPFFQKIHTDHKTVNLLTFFASTDHYLSEDVERIDMEKAKLPYGFDAVYPHLPVFACSLGMSYSEFKRENQLCKMEYNINDNYKQTVTVMQFAPNPDCCYVYPIAAKSIALRKVDTQKDLYSLYEAQKLCDLKIQALDGEVKCHSTVLYCYGGNAIRNSLDGLWEEAATRTISVNFSKKTIQAFLNFVYLGDEAMHIRKIAGEDLVELFKLAQYYNIESLIDHCTNAISLVAKPEHAKDIQKMADLYNNEHLKALAQHLKKA